MILSNEINDEISIIRMFDYISFVSLLIEY